MFHTHVCSRHFINTLRFGPPLPSLDILACSPLVYLCSHLIIIAPLNWFACFVFLATACHNFFRQYVGSHLPSCDSSFYFSPGNAVPFYSKICRPTVALYVLKSSFFTLLSASVSPQAVINYYYFLIILTNFND